MKLLKTLAHIGFRQAKNAVKLILGKSLNQPSFGSMTLDTDDIEIAKQYLGNHALWNNHQIIQDFENSFALWNGSNHAYSFMGGRVALSACIYALGLTQDDEVIIPGYTCVVVPNAFWYEGIKPNYCDIELETYGLNFEDLKRKVTHKTKAILLHHLYGLVSRDYEKIVSFAKERGIYVIEDCAHSTGANLHGKKVGNLGDVAFYSTEQSKILTTFNGGIAVTNNSELAKRIADFQKHAPFPD